MPINNNEIIDTSWKMKVSLINSLIMILGLSLVSCKSEKKDISKFDESNILPAINIIPQVKEVPFDSFNREEIKINLQNKILQKQPLIVHVFVPLCDNDNQGIVPVSASLGDGQNLKTNLYWGAGYGLKTHFKKTGWKIISDVIDTSNAVLERIIFEKNITPSARVIVIADAYAGDEMNLCLEDFFSNLAETLNDSVKINDTVFIDLNKADLVAFTGHNGLMDNGINEKINKSATPKDAVVIACISHSYFKERLNYVNAYPLVTTKSLMAPEAYVISAIINSWANMEDDRTIFISAASAYSTYQKCSLNAAKSIFKTGW